MDLLNIDVIMNKNYELVDIYYPCETSIYLKGKVNSEVRKKQNKRPHWLCFWYFWFGNTFKYDEENLKICLRYKFV